MSTKSVSPTSKSKATQQPVVLLPCPHCGNAGSIDTDHGGYFVIGCKTKDCRANVWRQVTGWPLEKMESEIASWNTRPQLTVSVENADGPAKVFGCASKAIEFARTTRNKGRIWWKSGSAITGQ